MRCQTAWCYAPYWWAVVWCSVVWCGVVWCGVMWCAVLCCTVLSAALASSHCVPKNRNPFHDMQQPAHRTNNSIPAPAPLHLQFCFLPQNQTCTFHFPRSLEYCVVGTGRQTVHVVIHGPAILEGAKGSNSTIRGVRGPNFNKQWQWSLKFCDRRRGGCIEGLGSNFENRGVQEPWLRKFSSQGRGWGYIWGGRGYIYIGGGA